MKYLLKDLIEKDDTKKLCSNSREVGGCLSVLAKTDKNAGCEICRLENQIKERGERGTLTPADETKLQDRIKILTEQRSQELIRLGYTKPQPVLQTVQPKEVEKAKIRVKGTKRSKRSADDDLIEDGSSDAKSLEPDTPATEPPQNVPIK